MSLKTTSAKELHVYSCGNNVGQPEGKNACKFLVIQPKLVEKTHWEPGEWSWETEYRRYCPLCGWAVHHRGTYKEYVNALREARKKAKKQQDRPDQDSDRNGAQGTMVALRGNPGNRPD